jgi:hypothetical protein
MTKFLLFFAFGIFCQAVFCRADSDFFAQSAGLQNASDNLSAHLKAVYEVRALGQTMMQSELTLHWAKQTENKGKPFQMTTFSKATGLLGFFVKSVNIFKTEGVKTQNGFIPFISVFQKGDAEPFQTVNIPTNAEQNIKDYQTAMLDMMQQVTVSACSGMQKVADGKRILNMTFIPLNEKMNKVAKKDKETSKLLADENADEEKACALHIDLISGKKKGWFWTREEKSPLLLWFSKQTVSTEFPLRLLQKAQMKAPFLGTIEIHLKTVEVF